MGEKIIVPAITLDNYCAKHSIVPTLMKIDAEGFDGQVVRGAQNALEKKELKAIIIETCEPEVIELLERKGFTRVSYDPLDRKLSKDAGESNNSLFVKDFNFVESRLKESDKVQVLSYSI